jgi:predicted dehydrogenase
MSSPDSHSADEPVRLALVGVGGHGHTLQDAIAATAAVELRATYDVDADALAATADRFGCAAAASYEAVLERDDLEAVVLATPNALHRPQAEAALAAGLDVLVEKPIANTVADGRAMIEAAASAGRQLMVGHDMRRSRTARRTRRALEAGRLGTVVSMEVHFSMDTALHLEADAWRLQPDQCPLLPMMQLGIHAVDLVQYFFTPMARVHATTRSVTTPDPVSDSVAATFQTRDGLHGTLISNYCSPVTFAYRITGTEATLRTRGHRLWIEAAGASGAGSEAESEEGRAEAEDYSAYAHESYVREIDAFAEAVRTGRAPETDGWTGLQALAVVEAMQRAAETGTPQDVPDVRATETAPSTEPPA